MATQLLQQGAKAAFRRKNSKHKQFHWPAKWLIALFISRKHTYTHATNHKQQFDTAADLQAMPSTGLSVRLSLPSIANFIATIYINKLLRRLTQANIQIKRQVQKKSEVK